MVDYNTQKVAEASAIKFDELIEYAKTLGFDLIRQILVNNPPQQPNSIVDPILVFKSVFDKIEMEYIKQQAKRLGGQNAYITTDGSPVKHRKPS